MKKRLICAAMILALLLALLPAHILADDPQIITGEAGEKITWTFEPIEGVLTIEGEGAMPDWSYSEGAPWYLYRSRIFRVVLGDKITSIGAYAFNECARLTEVDAAEATLGVIGAGAMSNCVQLETFKFKPASNLDVGADAFFGCTALKTVDLGADEGAVGAGAFSGCTALTEAALPKVMFTLEPETFLDCAALSKLNVPEELESIGKSCFRGCEALPDLTFPDSLVSVDRYAFHGCTEGTFTFTGNMPDFAPAKDVSASFAPDAVLCFPFESDGWTWPVCKGYETKIVYPALDNVFNDLKKDAWYIPSVQHVYYTGLMNGVKEDVFSPDGLVSRGQLVTVLYRMAGQIEVEKDIPFTDVAETAYYYKAVRWANSTGVVNGVSPTLFAPDESISRQQLCTVLFRYAASRDLTMTQRDPLTGFSDADKIADYAKDAVSWCVATGLINGKNGSLLDPEGNATRAEIAKVLTAFAGHVAREGLTAHENWEQDYLIPEVIPDIDREDPEYLYAREIFDAINAVRGETGLKPFIWSDRVYLAAQTRAEEISGQAAFTHTRPDGSNYATVLTESGVNASIRNEIIAHGYSTSQALVDKWASSNATSPVINALVYSQAAVGVYKLPPEEEGEEGHYYYALLVIG